LPTEEQLLEIHRLAVLGGAAAIAHDVTVRLAGTWTGLSHFREVQALCLKTLELGHTPRTLSYLAKAKTVLGEVEEAMRLYCVVLNMFEDASDRAGIATTLTNIGAVYHRTGHPALALES
jgi:hypothetical protein